MNRKNIQLSKFIKSRECGLTTADHFTLTLSESRHTWLHHLPVPSLVCSQSCPMSGVLCEPRAARHFSGLAAPIRFSDGGPSWQAKPSWAGSEWRVTTLTSHNRPLIRITTVDRGHFNVDVSSWEINKSICYKGRDIWSLCFGHQMELNTYVLFAIKAGICWLEGKWTLFC